MRSPREPLRLEMSGSLRFGECAISAGATILNTTDVAGAPFGCHLRFAMSMTLNVGCFSA